MRVSGWKYHLFDPATPLSGYSYSGTVQTSVPTAAPTAAPSEIPTASPSEIPTASPSETSTAIPSSTPTKPLAFSYSYGVIGYSERPT